MSTNIPKLSARFETTPVANITAGVTTFSLATATDIYGGSLSGLYGFSIDEGQSTQEFFLGTVSGTTISGIQAITNAADPLNSLATGLQQAHRKSAVVKITDYPLLAYLREIVNGNTNYTLDNILAYTSSPTFTLANQLITKTYADALAIAGAPDASTSVKGIVQEATAAQINSGTATGSTGAILTITPDQLVLSNMALAAAGNDTSIAVGSSNKLVTQTGLQKSTEKYATTTGSANAYVATLSPAPTSLVTGMKLTLIANFTNTGAATLAVNGLGSTPAITKLGTTALVSGDIASGNAFTVVWDGTRWQLQNPTPNSVNFSSGLYKMGLTSYNMASTTGAQTIAHGLGVIPKYIRITSEKQQTTASVFFIMKSVGVYNGSTTATLWNGLDTSNNDMSGQTDTTNIIVNQQGSASINKIVATATFDATNITLTFTASNSPSGTLEVLWEAFA